jgi:peptidoglycan/xylan/chitin deacetylase (PgdA/CDA1 family)
VTGAPPATVPVLAYHDVAVLRAGTRPDPWVVGKETFREQLDALLNAGWSAKSIGELPTEASAIDPKVVYLTFDDGFTSFADIVVPLLAERSMQATVFVPSAFIGGTAGWLGAAQPPSLMSWEELRALRGAGMEVGSHGHRHLQSDLLTAAEVSGELSRSRGILEDGLGLAVDSLAYPFGYNDRRARSAAAAAGYRLACEVGCARHPVRPDLRFAIRRLVVGPDVSGTALLALIEAGQRSPSRDRAYRAVRPVWRATRKVRFAVEHRQHPTVRWDRRPQ